MHIGFTALIKTCLKTTCNTCSSFPRCSRDIRQTPRSLSMTTMAEYDIILHGVGGREFKKIIKDIENICAGAKRAICMHCVQSRVR